ncbi:hypothetical protein Hanom_Chr05g00463891 [Helianthus anomalus]
MIFLSGPILIFFWLYPINFFTYIISDFFLNFTCPTKSRTLFGCPPRPPSGPALPNPKHHLTFQKVSKLTLPNTPLIMCLIWPFGYSLPTSHFR